MNQYSAKDTFSAKEGRAFKDGIEMMNLIKFNVVADKKKMALSIMGRRVDSHRANGLTITGTITEFKANSDFAMQIREYKRTGKDVYFNMMGVIEDPQNNYGSERITVVGVNIDSVNLIDLDADGDVIRCEIPFTAEDFDIEPM